MLTNVLKLKNLTFLFLITFIFLLNVEGKRRKRSLDNLKAPLNYTRRGHGNIIVNIEEDVVEADNLRGPERTSIIFYSDIEYEGDSISFRMDGRCMTIPRDYREMTRSVDTQGSCVYLYTKNKCRGGRLRVMRHDSSSKDLEYAGMSTSSARLCRMTDTEIIILYKHSQYSGLETKLRIPNDGTCVDLPESTSDTTSSVEIPSDSACIILWTDYGCRGRPLRVYPSSQGGDDLTNMNMNDEVSSVQSCAGADNGKVMYMHASQDPNGFEQVENEEEQIIP